MKRISIVLPVYNEQEGLALFHEALRAALDGLSSRYTFEIIYVLDRSRDGSFSVLRKLAASDPAVTALHLSRRFGHQLSLVAGIDYSQGDAIIMMDCDLQHPPEIISQLLEKYEQGFDIVQTIRAYDARAGLLKRWTSHLFYRLQNFLSPIEIEDGAADFRLISRKVADVFRTGIREQNQFLRGLFRWVGFKNTEVHFVSPPRSTGRTKYRMMRLLAFSITGITSFSKVPLRLSSLLGMFISVASGLYGIVTTALYFVSGSFPPGYASLIVTILFIGGLQLVVLGIIGEYVGSIFDEVKRRPLYIVDEIIKRQGE
jgi:glycosyltransferase involved in cell wall biosynthesis